MSIDTIQAVSEAVQLYFDALYECSLAKFDRVFHPSSSLFDATDGVFTAMPIADYRAVIEKRPVHILDVAADPEYTLRETTLLAGQRTTLGVPLLREDEPIGVIVLARSRVEAFTQKQIDLVTTFADQAVIAIENVRLFDELHQRTDDLSEALTYQTGSANILKVIASSPTDVKPVLEAIVESACELCEAYDAVVLLKDG